MKVVCVCMAFVPFLFFFFLSPPFPQIFHHCHGVVEGWRRTFSLKKKSHLQLGGVFTLHLISPPLTI